MPCFRPVTCWKPPDGGPVQFVEKRDHREIEIPCGQCIGCRINRQQMWAFRCLAEASLHPSNWFATLTYSPERLPPRGELRHRDWQLFAKRVRRSLGPFRYLMCGEYGEQTQRPHYHALLFGLDIPDIDRFSVRRGYPVFRSEKLSQLWGRGIVELGSVTPQSARYCSGYVLKDCSAPQVLDEETGEIRPVFQNKVLAGTGGTTVGADGVYSEVKPINTLWSTKTTRRAAGLAGSAIKTRTTNIVVDYFWPAVLSSITQIPWARKDGTTQMFTLPVYARNAYNGPCKAQKVEEWSATAPAPIVPDVLDPMPIVYNGPNVQFSIPACLHANYTFNETVGTNDPVWVAGIFSQTFPATNFATWPASVVASFSVRRLYGGFLSQLIRVYSPA